jgi:hypothetical protein
MKCDTEFPRVGKENSRHIAGPDPGGNQGAGNGLDGVSVFRIGHSATGASIDQGGLGGIAAAGGENEIVQKEIVGIGVEFGALHSGWNCSGKKKDRKRKG